MLLHSQHFNLNLKRHHWLNNKIIVSKTKMTLISTYLLDCLTSTQPYPFVQFSIYILKISKVHNTITIYYLQSQLQDPWNKPGPFIASLFG